MNTMPLEAATRQLIDTNLKNLGWEFTGRNQNVYLEQPKTEEERKKLGGKRPDYVLYSKDSDKPLIVIEAKKKGERIDIALEQGIFYAKQLEAPLVYATDGVFCKSFHTLGNATPKLNGEDVDEFIREALAIRFLASWEVNTVSPKVQYDRKELIKIFDETNDMLRRDGLRAGIERFGEFANILFLKLISESEKIKKESGTKSNFSISCDWDTIKNIPINSRIDYINNMVYENLNKLYQTEIFTPLTIRDNSILKDISDKLDLLTLTDVDSDVKGDAFEYFLKASTASRNDLGEYFTPRHIVKTMVRLINPQIGEKMYDPFCGTGGFLIETFRHIYNNMSRNENTVKMLREQTIYGNEITNTARITKMNMILAGDGHSNIDMKDSLAKPIEGKYDVVLANMPYSQKTRYGNLYDLPSTNGDSVCVQHCMKAISALSENGRMALVVPEGFLFRKDLAKAREYMLENCQLQSVISLPQGVFLPYTGVKTNIIYATKVNQKLKSSEKRKDFWFFNIKSDGKTLDSHRRDTGNGNGDLDKYLEYRKLDNAQKDNMLQVGFEIIPFDKVSENSFVLVGSRYRERNIPKNMEGEIKALEDIAVFSPSKNELKKLAGDTLVSFVPMADMNAHSISFMAKEEKPMKEVYSGFTFFKDNDVLLAKITPCFENGKAGIARNLKNGVGFGSTEYIVIRANTDIVYPEWIYYHINSSEFLNQGKGFMTGTAGQQRIDINFVKGYSIVVPPLDIQKEIVTELENYQRIIDGAKAVVGNYKPKIQIKDSWGIEKLSTLCDINVGTIDPVKVYGENSFTYIDIASVENNTGKMDISNKVIGINAPSRARRTFKRGDILMSTVRPNLKAFGYVDFEPQHFVASTGFAVLSPTQIDGKYLYYMLFDDYVGKQLSNTMGKGMYPSVNKDDLEYLDIPLPPIEMQKDIVAEIEAEQALIEPSKQLIEAFTKKIQDKINVFLVRKETG